MAQVFISYDSEIKAQALDIVRQLENAGISCWISCRDIGVGADYTYEIPVAIDQCTFFLLLLTNRALESLYIRREVDLAISKKKEVMPLMMEAVFLDTRYDFLLRVCQIYDYYQSPSRVMQNVLSKIKGVPYESNPDDHTERKAEDFFRKAVTRYSTDLRNTPETARLFRNAAILGHAQAQFYYAFCLAKGYGVTPNDKESLLWYQKSADQNYPDAQYNLAYCYYHGIGTDRDRNAAFRWYVTAAENGHLSARAMVGFCLETGTGTAADPEAAGKHYLIAANQGNSFAQRRLGICYARGLGVDPDPASAIKWLRKAAAQGDQEAQKWLTELE